MSDLRPISDVLRPFQIERTQLRGRAVRLGAVVDRVLGSHGYPEPVSLLLGELMVLAAGFAGGLKFEGMFSLQLRGDGPVGMMVADVTNSGAMRGHASFDAAAVAAAGGEAMPGLECLLGKGLMALTVDQTAHGGQVYQGIVELGRRSLQDAMLAYFQQSEQVPTGIRSAIHHDPVHETWCAGAVIVQAMPGEGPADIASARRDDDWRRTMLLLQTLTDHELVNKSLPLDDLLMRLFHEDGVRAFPPLTLAFECSCSVDRVKNMLRQFGATEIEDMRDNDGRITVTCEFCSKIYRFDDQNLSDIMRGLPN
ncbi:MAG: Hsp33 family molecular chaperone HslO [Geminicoccaceae bacterium]|nr:Hsp33 family molecular chaperone HslO [Geminicoccaceae bacterium]